MEPPRNLSRSSIVSSSPLHVYLTSVQKCEYGIIFVHVVDCSAVIGVTIGRNIAAYLSDFIEDINETSDA